VSSPDSAAARDGRLIIGRVSVLVLGIGIGMTQYYRVLGSFSGIVLTLVINSNLGPISHRYWDTATSWLKIANFQLFPTPSHLAPSFGVTPSEFMEKLYNSWN